MYADDIVLLSPSAKGLQKLADATDKYGTENDIIFNGTKSQVMFLDTRKTGNVTSIRLGDIALNFTSSYKYLGHIITNDLSDDADIKEKIGSLCARSNRSNMLLRKFHFCSDDVNNKLFSSYCSNLYLCSLWAKYKSACTRRFIVAYSNGYIILHSLPMRCSAIPIQGLLLKPYVQYNV